MASVQADKKVQPAKWRPRRQALQTPAKTLAAETVLETEDGSRARPRQFDGPGTKKLWAATPRWALELIDGNLTGT